MGMLLAMLPSPGEAQSSDAIAWTECDDAPAWECGVIDVPVDHSEPADGEISLAVARLRAADESNRVGVLVVNFGGPGFPAILPAQHEVEFFGGSFSELVPPVIRERFDIVAFDPRGVGESNPLNCDQHMNPVFAAPVSDEPAVADGLLAAWKEAIDRCRADNPGLLENLGTASVALDMESVRAALGEERLSYLGFSYGAVLGAVYADMFPERVRAMVLDGAFDYWSPLIETLPLQVSGLQASYRARLADCEAKGCFLAEYGEGDARVGYERLHQELSARPASTRKGTDADGATLATALVVSLYRPERWEQFAAASEAAADGAGAGLASLAALWNLPPGAQAMANALTVCADSPAGASDPVDVIRADIQLAGSQFGEAVLLGVVGCLGYEGAEAQHLPAPVAERAPPIMVVTTTGDPVTPIGEGLKLAESLRTAFVLEHDGEGHTAFTRGIPCVDEAVAAYLLDPGAGGRVDECQSTVVPLPVQVAEPEGEGGLRAAVIVAGAIGAVVLAVAAGWLILRVRKARVQGP